MPDTAETLLSVPSGSPEGADLRHVDDKPREGTVDDVLKLGINGRTGSSHALHGLPKLLPLLGSQLDYLVLMLFGIIDHRHASRLASGTDEARETTPPTDRRRSAAEA